MELTCDMHQKCTMRITHIDDKGYIYCLRGADERRGTRPVRKLRTWELRLLQRGEQVPSYRPISQREYLAAKREQYIAQQEDAQGVLDPLNHATD